jgi:5-methyltetrahydropteroyltriglutamate--homocysteine methyltransferase
LKIASSCAATEPSFWTELVIPPNPQRLPRLNSHPLRTSVIGSYPFPGWLELASQQLDRFGPDDLSELQDDAVVTALHDQLAAGLDVVTDGEQTRLDFNLSFYGYIQGIDLESVPSATLRSTCPRPARQTRRHRSAQLRTPRPGRRRGIQTPPTPHRPFQKRDTPTLKASVPAPTRSPAVSLPNPALGYPDRWALTEALLPLVRKELDRPRRRWLPGDQRR